MSTSLPSTPRHNLRLFRLNGFVDRDHELALVRDWMTDAGGTPLALIGPPGSGKSSLATSAAWTERDRYPGGIVWVGAVGGERFRLEDIYFAIDAVVGTSILTQPAPLRVAAAITALDAEPRLLVLDELERVTDASWPDLLDLLQRLVVSDKSRALLISELEHGSWDSLPISVRVRPAPLDAVALAKMAQTDLVPAAARGIAEDRFRELASLTDGIPLRARLALGLTDKAVGWAAIAQDLASLKGAPLADWLALAEASLRVGHPQASRLLARLTLASSGVDLDVLRSIYFQDLGTPGEAVGALDTLVRRGLVSTDETRAYVHPAVREFLAGQLDPASDPESMRHLESQLQVHYLELAEQYSRRPKEEWSDIDIDWPNIRQSATRAVDLMEAAVAAGSGGAASGTSDRTAGPGSPHAEQQMVEAFARSLLPLILWRQPRDGHRWLTAGQEAARALGHVRTAAQMEAALGGLCYLENDAESAIEHFRRARSEFETLGDVRRLMHTELELGAVLRNLGRHREAIETYQDAVRLAEKAGDELDRAAAYAQLGAAYNAGGEPFRAVEWMTRARPPLEREGGPALSALLNNLGLAYEAIGRYRDAIDVYVRSYEMIVATTQAAQRQQSTVAGNIGAAYYEVGELDEALRWYRRDLSLSQAAGDLVGTAATHHNIGHVLLEMGVPQGAAAEFHRAREIYERLGMAALVAEEDEAIEHAQSRMADRASDVGS